MRWSTAFTMRAWVCGDCSHVDDRKSAMPAIPGSPPVGRMQGTTYGRTEGPIVTTKENGGCFKARADE
jgi:hypothetical protein